MQNSQKNTHVQHSYTHQTVYHPRPEVLFTQEVIHIQITSSASGLTHDAQAVDARRVSTH